MRPQCVNGRQQSLQCGCSAHSIADFGFDGQLLAAVTGSSRLGAAVRNSISNVCDGSKLTLTTSAGARPFSPFSDDGENGRIAGTPEVIDCRALNEPNLAVSHQLDGVPILHQVVARVILARQMPAIPNLKMLRLNVSFQHRTGIEWLGMQ